MDIRLEAFANVKAHEEGYKSALESLISYIQYTECHFQNVSQVNGDPLPLLLCLSLRKMHSNGMEILSCLTKITEERTRYKGKFFESTISVGELYKQFAEVPNERMSPLTLPSPLSPPVSSENKVKSSVHVEMRKKENG